MEKLARAKNLDLFRRMVFLLRKQMLINCNMSTSGKKGQPPTGAIVNVGRPTLQYTVKDAVKLVSFSLPTGPANLKS